MHFGMGHRYSFIIAFTSAPRSMMFIISLFGWVFKERKSNLYILIGFCCKYDHFIPYGYYLEQKCVRKRGICRADPAGLAWCISPLFGNREYELSFYHGYIQVNGISKIRVYMISFMTQFIGKK